jgi:hypothetical protein
MGLSRGSLMAVIDDFFSGPDAGMVSDHKTN